MGRSKLKWVLKSWDEHELTISADSSLLGYGVIILNALAFGTYNCVIGGGLSLKLCWYICMYVCM